MALTRESINGRYNAQVTALGARPSKYRREPVYRTNPRNGIRTLIGYNRRPNNKEIQRYTSKVSIINRNRNTELQRLALQQSNVPQWAKAKASRAFARTPNHHGTVLSVAQNYVKNKEARNAYNRRTSITNAQSAAVRAEQNRQITLRKLQQQNKINQIRATTAQNQKVKRAVSGAGYDGTKLQRAGGRPSPRKEPVSNPEQRRFAAQQANRKVDETVVTSKQQSAAALIRATQTKKRHDSIIQQAKQRYQNRQQAKLNPALVSAVPMKFPEPIKYSNDSKQKIIDSLKSETPGKPTRDISEELFFVSPKVKRIEPKIGLPHQEYAKGLKSGIDDLYITGQNTIKWVQGKEQIPQKGNPLDNLLFAPLDAGIQSYEDNTDFTKNFNERVKKVETDFWANPAYSIGASVPSALIIGASVVVPPVAAVKYGIGILPKVPKVVIQ